MPKTLEQMIKEAKEELNKADKDTPDYTAAIAKVDALTSVQQAGITKTQDDLNRLDRQNKEAVRETLGMSLQDFEQVVAGVEESLPDGIGDGGEEEGTNVLSRMQSALEERDQKINSLSTTLTDVNTRYSKDRVEAAIEKAFQSARLDEKFLAPAKNLAAYSDLVEKASRGEEVTAEEINGKVENVKALSSVWFKAEQEGESGDSVVAGHRIKPEAIGIPATPDANANAEITEEDRAKRSSSIY